MVQGVFPARDLRPAPGGLLSVADVTEHDTAGQWANGPFGWDTLACPVRLDLADFCTNTAEGTIAESSGDPGASWPFGIVTVYECLTPGIKPDERRRIAVKQNIAGTQKALESELWAGYLAQASGHTDVRYLNDGNAVAVDGGAAVSVINGIAKLEQGLADCGLGVEGVIHLTRQAALIAASANAIVMDSAGVLHTALGTPVIAGVGYHPALETVVGDVIPAPPALGARADTQMGFATGPVVVHLGPSEFISENLDITTNALQTIAGRTAAVYWDSCCVVSVQMDTTP